jgi:hypothetical protein
MINNDSISTNDPEEADSSRVREDDWIHVGDGVYMTRELMERLAAAKNAEPTPVDPKTGIPKTIFGIPVVIEDIRGTRKPKE